MRGAPGVGSRSALDPVPVAAPIPVVGLTRRAEFLAAARAARAHTPAFTLQARRRSAGDTADPQIARVGFTCSKKVGNAVARNRAKRRLRAAVQAVLPQHAQPGWDYVLIGRRETTAAHPFQTLAADLTRALTQVHSRTSQRRPKPSKEASNVHV